MSDFEPVALVKCDTYEDSDIRKALDESLSFCGGLDFVQPGMKVGIKVNLVAAMDPEKAATTHPQLLKRLCELLTERGATVIIGDSPGGLYTEAFVKNVYRVCGLNDLVGEGVSLNEDFSVKNTEFPEAESIKTFSYTGWLDNVDAIINFSKLKTHAMMGMSCAVKNMFGTIPGTTKPEYHMRFPEEKAFANLMVDLNEYFKPVLYIVDAIDGMEGNGPTAGEKRHVGCILASRKPYALDMVCAGLIGMGIKDVQTLLVAKERGLGPEDVSEVEIRGDYSLEAARISDFKRATIHQNINFASDSLMSKAYASVIKLVCSTRPQVKTAECIGCKKCFETCPAKAITMVPSANKTGKDGQIPQIDRSKCIKCFCCQEFCPVGAMKVHYNPVGKLLNRIQGS